MGQPVLLAIDDDQSLLGDIERELRDRYGRHYQVVCVQSPADARAKLAAFAAAGVEVALVLAGRAAGSVELLTEVRHVAPPRQAGLAGGLRRLGPEGGRRRDLRGRGRRSVRSLRDPTGRGTR